MGHKNAVLYALSTCIYCNTIKKMFEELDIDHKCIQADKLSEQEHRAVIEEMKKVNPRCSFPTLVIDEVVITGFKEIKKLKLKAFKP